MPKRRVGKHRVGKGSILFDRVVVYPALCTYVDQAGVLQVAYEAPYGSLRHDENSSQISRGAARMEGDVEEGRTVRTEKPQGFTTGHSSLPSPALAVSGGISGATPATIIESVSVRRRAELAFLVGAAGFEPATS